jgi:gluconolactonase
MKGSMPRGHWIGLKTTTFVLLIAALAACSPSQRDGDRTGAGGSVPTLPATAGAGGGAGAGGATVDAGPLVEPPADAGKAPPVDAGKAPTVDAAPDAGSNPVVDANEPPPADAGPAEHPSRPAPGPNPYKGAVPAPGEPIPLGNTRIFDDSTGVVWNQYTGELLFSVDQINHIWRWRADATANMGFDVVRKGGEGVFGMRGLAITPDRALIVTETGGHRVTRSFPGYDTPVAIAERWPGGDGTPAGRFNSPFDVVARDDGNIYFTDPVLGAGKSPELGFTGIYRIDPAGKISLIARDLEPWALALSADHDTLFVSTGSHRDARAAGIYKFPILADGSVGPRSLFASGSVAGPPGGLAVDQAGNVYHAFFAVRIIGPDGNKLGTTIEVPGAADCAFGGADLKTLFVTAGSGPAVYNLFRVPMNIPGAL